MANGLKKALDKAAELEALASNALFAAAVKNNCVFRVRLVSSGTGATLAIAHYYHETGWQYIPLLTFNFNDLSVTTLPISDGQMAVLPLPVDETGRFAVNNTAANIDKHHAKIAAMLIEAHEIFNNLPTGVLQSGSGLEPEDAVDLPDDDDDDGELPEDLEEDSNG